MPSEEDFELEVEEEEIEEDLVVVGAIVMFLGGWVRFKLSLSGR